MKLDVFTHVGVLLIKPGRKFAQRVRSSAIIFYCFRSYDAAIYQRDTMASNPHFAPLYVSEVYKGRTGGWAWTVCWNCPRDPSH